MILQRICNNHRWDVVTHFLMNVHKLTPHSQATGLADLSLASAELKIPSKAESFHHNWCECKRTVRIGRNCNGLAYRFSSIHIVQHCGLCRPAYLSVFAGIGMEIGWQYGSTPVFLKIWTQSFQKVWKLRRERCKFVASEADHRALMGSYCSLTFVYFKPFLGLRYTAGPDWSTKLVKPMNIDFALKLYGS